MTISLEAIQHSLYYLHVPTAEDEVVRRSEEEHRRSYEDEGRPSVTINRKPLPPTTSNHPLPPIPQEEPYQSYGESQDYNTREGPLRVDTGPDFGINRRHFSSSPQPPALFEASGDYAVSPSRSDTDTLSHHQHHNGNPSTSRQSPPRDHGPSIHRKPLTTQQHIETPMEIARRTDPTFPAVTIIRRDPTSGSQWNVGTISLLQPTFTASPLRPVHVELTAPGYSRFNKIDFTPTRRGSGASDATSVRRAMEALSATPTSTTSPDFPVNPFTRTIDFRKIAAADLKRTVYQRTDSSDSIGRIQAPSKPGAEKNVLAFDSPWHGTCTFVNAIDGKTLKLKHTIQSPGSPTSEANTANVAELRFNLGWSILGKIKQSRPRNDEPDKLPIPHLLESKENFRKSFQHIRNKSRENFRRMRAHTTSNDSDNDNYQNEGVLRDLSNINTPTTNSISAYSVPRSTPYQDASNRHLSVPTSTSLYDQNDRSSANPTSSENEDEEGRISLKLGRERAGGGYRGNSAKLGKLVIEDEGLKMCDLVVGAAMGVWWQHYGVE